MIQTQNYIVKPDGKIKGGTASYTADLDTGHITYNASVQAGFWFFTKTFNFSGEYDADPADLRSDKLQALGDTLTVGDVQFTLLAIGDGYEKLSVQVVGKPMSGIAMADTTQEFLKITSLDATAQVSGYTVNLSLEVTS